MWKEKLTDSLLLIVFLVVLGVPVVGLLYLGTFRAADVFYKAGWMVAHWNDATEFPPGSNLCMHHFCTRTDTTLKHVGGRRGYTSEVQYYYCPIHNSDFVSTGGQFDGFLYFLYWAVAIICSFFLLVIPLFLILLPFMIVTDRFKKVSVSFSQRLDSVGGSIVAFGGVTILLVVWVMFAWW
jgi:hypothetical protein